MAVIFPKKVRKPVRKTQVREIEGKTSTKLNTG